jgi:hypothetical protein
MYQYENHKNEKGLQRKLEVILALILTHSWFFTFYQPDGSQSHYYRSINTFSNISVISWQSVLLVQETAILFDKEHGGH